jgi:hypothetical protein
MSGVIGELLLAVTSRLARRHSLSAAGEQRDKINFALSKYPAEILSYNMVWFTFSVILYMLVH